PRAQFPVVRDLARRAWNHRARARSIAGRALEARVALVIISNVRTLVTGASGFAGSLLSEALLREGHVVRAFGRDLRRMEAARMATPSRHEPQGKRQPPELAIGDAVSGVGLRQALEDVEVAYYLIHSMERSAAVGSF